jgi:hypothetical protein
LKEAFPELPAANLKTEDTAVGTTVKLLVAGQPPQETALTFSVADHSTVALLSIPGPTPAKTLGADTPLRASHYREALRNDCEDDFIGWLAMVKGTPEMPKAIQSRSKADGNTVVLQCYRAIKPTVTLFDGAKNRSVPIKRHEIVAHDRTFNLLARIANDNVTVFEWLTLVGQSFDDRIHNGFFEATGAAVSVPISDIEQAAGTKPSKPAETVNGFDMETPSDPLAFPLGEEA